MRKIQKNTVTVTLMLTSLVLLLVLEVFWLKGAYRDAEESFRKETSALFRSTVLAMHDSMIHRSLKPVAGDSLHRFSIGRRLHFNDSLHIDHRTFPDSNVNYINVTEKTAQIELFSSPGDPDSIEKILRPLITRIQLGKEPKRFIFRLDPDSLKADSIRFYYKKALERAGVHASFSVLTIRNERGERAEKLPALPRKAYVSEVVRLSPGNRYAVSFPGIDGLLWKEITPEILFSVFLTLLTAGSFYVMYKNLRAQQRLMEIKNDFISNITHELKTPVATVSVALEALKNFNAFDNPQRSKEYLDIAQNELNRLTLMTDKILKTAVFEDRGVDLKPEEVDIDLLIQQVLSSMKLVFGKQKTKVSFYKEGTDFKLEGSQAHLTNVLYNLVDNALKYSKEESSIDIALNSVNPHTIMVSVRDSGIGIAPEYQKKIFEKFFRVPSGDVHNTKGYGLGLSYVHSVAQSHGGEVKVESEPGKGSCFTIILPKKRED